MRASLVLLALVADASAFKFLSNFKAASLIPRPSNMLKRRKAAKVYGDKKIAVITGASSGLGLQTAAELLGTGEYHVFGAVRDLKKMHAAARDMDFPDEHFTALEVELGSFESVRGFCATLEKEKLNRPIDRLICNAAVYEPSPEPQWTVDQHLRTLQVNFLSHFLMVSLLLPGLQKSADPRVILVGGASAEENVMVYPRADLGDLAGLKEGARNPISMIDGLGYTGVKAYKDSKLALSMLSNILHDRYHKQTGIAFSTVYPGTIADSALTKDKPPLDTAGTGFDTGLVQAVAQAELQMLKTLGIGDNYHADGLTVEVGTVSVSEAAQRLLQVAHDGRCFKSGTFWAWLEGEAAEKAAATAADKRAGWESVYEMEPSERIMDFTTSQDLWKHATEITSAAWPPAYQPKSPCPTLVVVGAVTKAMNAKEEAKRTLEGLEPGSKPNLGGKVLGGAGYAIDAVAGNTVGRVAKFAQDKLLGDVPVDAVEGSFQETIDGKPQNRAASPASSELSSQEEAADAALMSKLEDTIEQVRAPEAKLS